MTAAEQLAFERTWANRDQHDGAKLAAIREAFGLGATTYYQRLNRLIDTEHALQLDAVTVYRLRRWRDRHRRARDVRA